ncbi:MAG: response regulator [Candidatus Rokubacteria bacterium]|nr:response regulator [Candidatus Rokubacteria bacterium]
MSTLAPPASRSRVLIVDDEIGPRESLRMLLKPAHEIKTADGARAALQEIAQFRPDLVIMDIKMPEMDGLEVLRRIKRIDPTIEVVMITAYASVETVRLALSHGAFEYLIKPFSRQDLESVVRRALGRREADLDKRGQVIRLVERMRSLAGKTRELEEAARREANEQSLRVTQLSILREIARTIVSQLDPQEMTVAVTEQLRRALGYDAVSITGDAEPVGPTASGTLVSCAIRDAGGVLGSLVVDNRASGLPIDPRETELLEMLSEFLAVAVRNSRLYAEIDSTRRSLEALIASAGDAIIAVKPDGGIEGWNPAAERIFGVAASAAIGRPIVDVLPAADYDDARRRLAHGTFTHSFEATTSLGDGRSVALSVTLSARRSGEGLIAIARDMTAQREVERQLHQSEKLAALGQLAGGIAHDFNNLLQSILGYAQLIKQNPRNAELVSRSLDVLETAAIDGAETVRRIQQFARLRPDERFVAVDLNEIVQEAVAITRPRWERTVAHENRPLELRLELGTVGEIKGRPAALTEMMTNLILNAIDAMPAGGTLTLGTRALDPIAIVTVADTGTGMSEQIRSRIFEPFFSTKGEGGSGLGLAMVYSIVTRHGGEIRVDSEPGRGTTFTMMFPIAGPEDADGDEGQEVAGARRAVRVLLVEDEEQVLATLSEMLRQLGHEVTTAAGGAAALAAFAPGRFDLALLNVGMPGMNGWELAERIRAVDPRIPLLFITGLGLRDDDRPRLDALKISACLFKPVRPGDLDAAIQAAAGV